MGSDESGDGGELAVDLVGRDCGIGACRGHRRGFCGYYNVVACTLDRG
jgi:hypothetical protein